MHGHHVRQEESTGTGGDDEALAWRSRVSLALLRGLFAIFALSTLLVTYALSAGRGHSAMVALTLAGTVAVGVPALTARPSGNARGWFVVIPSILIALAGYAQVGVLSGPGVVLTVSLMLAGLILGRKAMLGLTLASLVGVGGVGWAMVSGHLSAPTAADIAMDHAVPWIRSLAVTGMAVGLMGGLMLAFVGRIEHSLRLARSETRRREQAERARAEAEIMALESKQLETIGRLAAGVAHDFNNNLTAIMGCAELLRQDLAAQPEQSELAEGIMQASQRAAELTRQLLAYSRKAQMLLTPTDLHRLIEEAVSILRRSIDPSVEIVTRLEAQNAVIAADGALIESALLNLLVNARDAMPTGGTLTIATSSLADGATEDDTSPRGPCLALEISDTGRGIDAVLLPQIFDPFFTTKPIGRGTGLGLAAVSGTIKAHGGRVDVKSEPGRGSTFRVVLPSTPEESRDSRVLGETVEHGSGHILLVDDDAMVSRTATATLKSFGYEVTHAPDGKTALELVRAGPNEFALVLLDLRMPGLSGEATFDALRQLNSDLKVMIWSGYGAEQDVSSMLRRGAVGFVQKPYRVSELSRMLARALQSSRAREQHD